MDHIAIMKKSWKLIPEILAGTKTVESRWYKSKIAPWDRIKVGDTLYFKDSGYPVTVKSRVTKVDQYEVSDDSAAYEIMKGRAAKDLGSSEIPRDVLDYISGKRYAIFVSFGSVEKLEPFEINKKGFGAMSAWITVNDVRRVKL